MSDVQRNPPMAVVDRPEYASKARCCQLQWHRGKECSVNCDTCATRKSTSIMQHVDCLSSICMSRQACQSVPFSPQRWRWCFVHLAIASCTSRRELLCVLRSVRLFFKLLYCPVSSCRFLRLNCNSNSYKRVKSITFSLENSLKGLYTKSSSQFLK